MKIQISILLTLITLFSCQEAEISKESNFPEDGVIRVATEVKHSKAGMESSNLADFFLVIHNPRSSTYSYMAKMKRDITSTPNGEWNSYALDGTTPLQMLWQNGQDPVVVTTGKMGDNTPPDFTMGETRKTLQLPTDQATEEGVESADLLYSQRTVDPATDLTIDGKIAISKHHALSKLRIELTIGTEHNHGGGTIHNPLSEVEIIGTDTNFVYNFDNGGEVVSTNGKADIIPYLIQYTGGSETVSAMAEFEAIVVPQSFDGANPFSVSLMVNRVRYRWTSQGAVSFVEGKQHTLRLKVGKDLVMMGDIGIGDWIDGVGENIETE